MNPLKILFIIVLFSIQSCGTRPAQFMGTPFKTQAPLVQTGLSSGRLDSLTYFLQENLATTGMLVLQNGAVIYEYGNIEEVSYIASCRKSVLSILYGKYVDNGMIKLEETLSELGVDEDKGLLPIEKTASIKDVITSRSGVFYEPVNKGYDEANILKRGSVTPGSYFVYNNWDFNVAGHILETKSGKSVYQEIEEQLAMPLGFQDWNIKNQKKKYNRRKSRYPAYHIYLSTRDMAKIGQLMLNEGVWQGQQLISRDWIKQITTTVTPTDTVNARSGLNTSSPFQFSYGYMWWLVDNFKQHPDFEGAYTASGFGGQFITVLPKQNIVIAHKVKLPRLVRWGLQPGGISNHSYWQLLYDYFGQ